MVRTKIQDLGAGSMLIYSVAPGDFGGQKRHCIRLTNLPLKRAKHGPAVYVEMSNLGLDPKGLTGAQTTRAKLAH